MQNVGGMWLPDGDEHFAKTFAVDGHYHQEKLIDLAMPYVKNRRLAFDVGAHVGYMTRKMLEYFDHVVAWEPDQENYDCLKKNIDLSRATTWAWCLGDKSRHLGLSNPAPENSGAWHIVDGGVGFWAGTIDEGVWYLCPGLVKIDVQGMEGAVLRGGEKTIRAAKPVIIVEANNNNGVSSLLEDWGARKVGFKRRDQIWAWIEAPPLLEK